MYIKKKTGNFEDTYLHSLSARYNIDDLRLIPPVCSCS